MVLLYPVLTAREFGVGMVNQVNSFGGLILVELQNTQYWCLKTKHDYNFHLLYLE